MDKKDIKIEDIQRILFGNAPPEFLLEVLLRSTLIYLVLLIIVRLLGKRMKGQLTITEMAVMITLGAIISAPMQVPDRGIFQAALVLVVIMLLQQGLTWLGIKSRRVEVLTQGRMKLLVKDGVVQLKDLKEVQISRQELFAMIREKVIFHLGKIDRLYMEACGVVSIYTSKDTVNRPGLPVFPPGDKSILSEQQKAKDEINACTNCGQLQPVSTGTACSNCNMNNWTNAII